MAVVWIFRVAGSGASNHDVALSFAGFTNYDQGPYVPKPGRYQGIHALFWFTNGPQPGLWWLMSVSRKSGERWEELPVTNIWIHETVSKSDPLRHLDSPHMATLFSFFVSETNLPLRVVITSAERATGFRGIMDMVRQFDNDHIHKRSYIFISGRHYSVTNEFYAPK